MTKSIQVSTALGKALADAVEKKNGDGEALSFEATEHVTTLAEEETVVVKCGSEVEVEPKQVEGTEPQSNWGKKEVDPIYRQELKLEDDEPYRGKKGKPFVRGDKEALYAELADKEDARHLNEEQQVLQDMGYDDLEL